MMKKPLPLQDWIYTCINPENFLEKPIQTAISKGLHVILGGWALLLQSIDNKARRATREA